MRTRFLLSMLALLVLPGCDEVSKDRPPAPRPNIILISLDTLRPDHLPFYGYSRQTAPVLSRIASAGVVFERAYSQAPKTAPSHMSLFTGLYPGAHGVRNLSDGQNPALSSEIPMLAELLQAAGYRTGGFTGGGHMVAALGFHRGFERFVAGRATLKFALRWLKHQHFGEAPVFVFYHTYAVHDPYVTAPRFQVFNDPEYRGRIIGDPNTLKRLAGGRWWDQRDLFWSRVDLASSEDLQRLRDLYDAGILVADSQVERLKDGLRSKGLLEDALVIVLSDHGEEFLEHGGFLHRSLYQENLRVPLLMQFPSELGEHLRGVRFDRTVRLIDLLPTLVEYLELPAPTAMQGRSFLGRLRDPGLSERPDSIVSEWPEAGQKAIEDDGWKMIVDREGSRELYHLAADPGELDDLSGRAAGQTTRLGELLQEVDRWSAGIRQRVVEGELQELDPEIRRQLKALGYLE